METEQHTVTEFWNAWNKKMAKQKGEMDKPTVTVGDFNKYFSVNDRIDNQ